MSIKDVLQQAHVNAKAEHGRLDELLQDLTRHIGMGERWLEDQAHVIREKFAHLFAEPVPALSDDERLELSNLVASQAAEIDGLKASLEKKQRDIAQLKEDVANSDNEVDRVSGLLAAESAKDSIIGDMRDAIAAATKRTDEAVADAKLKSEQIEALRTDLAAAKDPSTAG